MLEHLPVPAFILFHRATVRCQIFGQNFMRFVYTCRKSRTLCETIVNMQVIQLCCVLWAVQRRTKWISGASAINNSQLVLGRVICSAAAARLLFELCPLSLPLVHISAIDRGLHCWNANPREGSLGCMGKEHRYMTLIKTTGHSFCCLSSAQGPVNFTKCPKASNELLGN